MTTNSHLLVVLFDWHSGTDLFILLMFYTVLSINNMTATNITVWETWPLRKETQDHLQVAVKLLTYKRQELDLNSQ